MESLGKNKGNSTAVSGELCNTHSTLKWDGEMLGNYGEDSILQRVKCNPLNIWQLRLEVEGCNFLVWAAVQQCQNAVPSLVDEIAGIYNLSKLGTHRAYFTLKSGKRNVKKLFTLYRVNGGNAGYERLPIYRGSRSAEFEDEVELLLLLRIVMGQRHNGEGSFIVVNGRPSSFRHCEGSVEGEPMDIEKGALSHYFQRNSLSSVAAVLNAGVAGMSFENILELTIRRVCPQLCWYRGLAISRLNQIL